jgi:hypothetical protein
VTTGLDYDDTDDELMGDDDEDRANDDLSNKSISGLGTFDTIQGTTNNFIGSTSGCVGNAAIIGGTVTSNCELIGLTATPPLGVAVAQAISSSGANIVSADLLGATSNSTLASTDGTSVITSGANTLMTPIDKLYSMQSSYFSALSDCDNCH